MKVIKLTESSFQSAVNEAITVLKNGGLVVAPSDTVYGLLVDASNETAIHNLMQLKNRPAGKSISVFVADFEMLEGLVEVNDTQRKMLHTLLPGSYTVVLPSKHKVSSLLEAEDGTLGVRLISYPFPTELVKAYGKPVTATSANLSGQSPHHSVESLLNQFSEKKRELIDLVIDAGQLARNKPSTVLNLSTPTVKVLRQGDMEWKSEESFKTDTEGQTKQKAQEILNKIITSNVSQKPVVIILKGDLGAGKTVFVKGLAEVFGITEIISPTFTIYYEYRITNSEYEHLYHYDLYNVETKEEFKHLGFEKYLKEKNIICVEWGEKAGELIELFKEKAYLVFVEIKYIDQNTREILVKEN
jgi:L-threonylcarbamoyladenylate synthase